MPIYEYKCQDCNFLFETINLSNRKKLILCPKCKNQKVKKLISSSFIRPEGIPKGSGGFSNRSCKSNILS